MSLDTSQTNKLRFGTFYANVARSYVLVGHTLRHVPLRERAVLTAACESSFSAGTGHRKRNTVTLTTEVVTGD